MSEIWGDKPEELYRNPRLWTERIHEEDKNRVIESFEKLVEKGESFDVEFRIVRDDGSIRWIHDQGFPIYDSGEDLVRLAGLAQDITEEKGLEERFKELFNASPDPIILIDKNGVLQEVNQAAVDVLGYDQEEIVGKSITEVPFISPEPKEKIAEKFKKRLQGGESSPYTIEGETKNGEQIFAEVNATLIDKEGKPAGIIAVVRNITGRKEAEDREEFLHSLLRHDVRNKAQIVAGYLELLEGFDLPEDAREYLKKGKRGIRESMDIIEKVRMLRKAEEEEVGAVKIEPIIESVVEENRSEARERSMEIEMKRPGIIPYSLVVVEWLDNIFALIFGMLFLKKGWNGKSPREALKDVF